METFLIIMAILCGIVGLVGCVAPVLPGPPLSYAGLLLIYFSGRTDYSIGFLAISAAVVTAVVVVDYIIPAYMTRRSGGSRASVRWSVAGMIVGFLLFPPLGIFVGTLVGAFVGEMIGGQKEVSKAMVVALGAFVGFVLGTGLKLAASGVILYYIVRPII